MMIPKIKHNVLTNILSSNAKVSSLTLLIAVAVFLTLFGNISFFSNVSEVYPVDIKNIIFLISLTVVLTGVNILLLTLFCYKHTVKPILIAVVLVSALAAFFMDSYNVVIDDNMIDNLSNTNISESIDLFNIKLVGYFIILGLLPSVLIYNIQIQELTLKTAVIRRLRLVVISLSTILIIVFSLGNFYAPFFREYKSLRFYANPSYYLYSATKYFDKYFQSKPTKFKTVGLDAQINHPSKQHKMVIMVVGETARADHFSLNGYSTNTNPYLEKENIINFNNTWSCGTSTAISVPCMFSKYSEDDFSKNKAKSTSNALDILQFAGVDVSWLDNNSDSKDVAIRIPYTDYKNPNENPVCDIECRDEGMLANLQSYIDQKSGDIFVVLHQMGSHGPAYYKRYPARFEKFQPSCQTNLLGNCSSEEINNAYDNTILYTDYFLSKVIKILKNNADLYKSALLYISDHGESLGESGLYLHGLPYLIAPDTQKHVPLIMWFSDRFGIKTTQNYASIARASNNKYTHDNIFHTILGLMDINTSVYDKKLDILKRLVND